LPLWYEVRKQRYLPPPPMCPCLTPSPSGLASFNVPAWCRARTARTCQVASRSRRTSRFGWRELAGGGRRLALCPRQNTAGTWSARRGSMRPPVLHFQHLRTGSHGPDGPRVTPQTPRAAAQQPLQHGGDGAGHARKNQRTPQELGRVGKVKRVARRRCRRRGEGRSCWWRA
jgi:hypothetical protein